MFNQLRNRKQQQRIVVAIVIIVAFVAGASLLSITVENLPVVPPTSDATNCPNGASIDISNIQNVWFWISFPVDAREEIIYDFENKQIVIAFLDYGSDWSDVDVTYLYHYTENPTIQALPFNTLGGLDNMISMAQGDPSVPVQALDKVDYSFDDSFVGFTAFNVKFQIPVTLENHNYKIHIYEAYRLPPWSEFYGDYSKSIASWQFSGIQLDVDGYIIYKDAEDTVIAEGSTVSGLIKVIFVPTANPDQITGVSYELMLQESSFSRTYIAADQPSSDLWIANINTVELTDGTYDVRVTVTQAGRPPVVFGIFGFGETTGGVLDVSGLLLGAIAIAVVISVAVACVVVSQRKGRRRK